MLGLILTPVSGVYQGDQGWSLDLGFDLSALFQELIREIMAGVKHDGFDLNALFYGYNREIMAGV